ncbi:acireductone synthase [Ectothiorhodospira mobilis]|uniref:acireductone synthase n=1 Tax=Ectothiorhodospira mobilis TaxID=195064 RepID=UPI00190611DB|nr:acireductone synthase [Ectothiorhodospira mobilis]MBK1692204.1 acireductone synthase [Ectothiorhodospira mobilis]
MTQAILTDIEGVLCPTAFIRQVLIPYSLRHLPDFLAAHREDPQVRRLLADVRAYAGGALDETALVERMRAWIEAEQQITPLKALQGLIWEAGYRRGEFQTPVEEDMLQCLRSWHDRGVMVYLFSTGSVHAQDLCLAHSEAGDLRPLVARCFDTRIGGKRQTAAYKAIAAESGHPPAGILCLGDRVAELDAAAAAGLQTCCLRRAGDTRDAGGHPVAASPQQAEAAAASAIPH